MIVDLESAMVICTQKFQSRTIVGIDSEIGKCIAINGGLTEVQKFKYQVTNVSHKLRVSRLFKESKLKSIPVPESDVIEEASISGTDDDSDQEQDLFSVVKKNS